MLPVDDFQYKEATYDSHIHLTESQASMCLCCSVGFVTQSQQKPCGWVQDNRGHLLSVCFLWCPATKLCCQNTQGYPCAPRCAWGPAHWSTFIAYWLRWGTPVSCQSPDTIAAVFEKVFVVAGSLHNRAINLNWSSLVEHRKTFSSVVPLSYIKSELISG